MRGGSKRALRFVLWSGAFLLLLSLPASAQVDSLKDSAAPHFDLPTYTGDQQVSLEDQRGKIVVLHFGTGW